ncbi:MAG: TolC family protein [Deltaproteobacteria bacterium]|nr:MAG: TolC family protein [Deltaproteobacteria bacterium]
MPRARTIACTVLLAAATPSLAESPTPWRAAELLRQWRPGVPASPALAVPHPITRDEQVQPVSLKEAIALALQNNPGIAAQRLEPGRQDETVLQAQAQFDPTFAGELLHSHSVTPNTSSLAGTRTTVVDDRSANFHLFKELRPGTVATIDFLNDRLDNNARFNQLRPQYKPQLNFSLVQPLLRNFGWDFSYLVVHVAEQSADAALYQFEAQLADFVETVIGAYWNVVRARETLAVQRESKALADRTVEENEARVRVGLLPPVATLEAQADAKSREELVIIAENDLAIARQQLAQLVYYRPDGTFVPRTLEPAEEAAPEDLRVDLDETLAIALAERPEIAASARGVQVQQLNEKIAGNGLLPRLDMVGSYGVNGISGQNRPIISTFDTGAGNCFPNPGSPGTFICNSPFGGPASEAYERLTSNDFRSYSFGLQFQVPLSNALARSEYSQSRIAREQAELNHRELLSRVTLEARQTVSDVITSRQRIDTARVARELAEENLRNQHCSISRRA